MWVISIALIIYGAIGLFYPVKEYKAYGHISKSTWWLSLSIGSLAFMLGIIVIITLLSGLL